MGTFATDEMTAFAEAWEKLFKSAKFSGIVGDKAHQARGGYHIGRAYQSSSNYSVMRPEDRDGNGSDYAASAVDMTLDLKDMRICHNRLRAAFRAKDRRLKYVNAWNGWDGKGDAGRYDVYASTMSTASADHKWHIHLEFRRKYANSPAAMGAVLSVLRGTGVPDPAPAAVASKPPAVIAWPLGPKDAFHPYLKSTPPVYPTIKTVQVRLNKLGYHVSTDGRYGAETNRAILDVQHKHDLYPDGLIGPDTWNALFS